MKQSTILLTSFQPWLDHHKSNASDDLLEKLQAQNLAIAKLIFLRNLPVETQSASEKTIAAIQLSQPDIVICCGMAESRDRLTIESQAFDQDQHYQTTVDLTALTESLSFTTISHDAGKFVCEGLYFHVLKYLCQAKAQTKAIFLHVPIFTNKNEALILKDVTQMLEKLVLDQT